MSIAAAALGGASLLGNAAIGVGQMIGGKDKREQGERDAMSAELSEYFLKKENEEAQASQQAQMEGLSGQGMAEISALQSRYDERAREGIPTELKEQYLENIQGSQAASLNAMNRGRAGLVGVANLDQNAVGAYKELLAMDANQKLANEQQAMGFQGNSIGQLDALRNRGLEFGIENQRSNFGMDLSKNYSDQDYAMALQGAGEQMMYSGANQLTNTLGQASSFAAGGGFGGGGGGASPDGLGGGTGNGFSGTMDVPNQTTQGGYGSPDTLGKQAGWQGNLDSGWGK